MAKYTINRRAALLGLGSAAALSGLAFPTVVQAQAFPSRPIRMVVGFAPGGITDLAARLLAPYISEALGQQVVVDNKPGAAGNVGTEIVVKAQPDGHTILMSSMTQIVVNPNTYAVMPVDPVKGLVHISMVTQGDLILASYAGLPATNAAEFVALAKKEPGKLNFGTAGAGGINHVVCELFKLRTGTDITSVHYRGSGPMIPDLLAGQVQACIDGVPIVEPHVKSGKLRALMVASKKRNPIFPDTPTANESGVPDFDSISNWFGLHAPHGTPAPIVDKLRAALRTALATPLVKERMTAVGIVPVGDDEASFAATIEANHRLFGEVARAAKIRIE